MLTLDFPGSRTLIDAIDAAVVKPTTHELTDSLRNSLCKLIRENAVTLPDCVFEANAEHYARRELYRSEEHGYCVVAMTWRSEEHTSELQSLMRISNAVFCLTKKTNPQ